MMLYIVLRHPNDKTGNWPNQWSEDNPRVIELIPTTVDVAKQCRAERLDGKRVAIYRCAYGNNPATICCTAEIESEKIDKDYSEVRFKNQIVLFNHDPKYTASPKENSFRFKDIEYIKAA